MSSYAQMDFILAQQNWKNSVQNIDTKVGAPFDSDHKILFAEVRKKLARKKKKKEELLVRYWKPEEKENNNEREKYNQEIMRRAAEVDWDNVEDASLQFAETLKEAAFHTLAGISPEIKNDYISRETWELIQLNQTHGKSKRALE